MEWFTREKTLYVYTTEFCIGALTQKRYISYRDYVVIYESIVHEMR
jgi:hypothetical protein